MITAGPWEPGVGPGWYQPALSGSRGVSMAPFFCCPSVSSVEETWSDGMESRCGADFGILAAALLPEPPPGAASSDNCPPPSPGGCPAGSDRGGAASCPPHPARSRADRAAATA